jgi:hypothetical protein
MNERIRIEFEMDGQPLPIESLDANGVRFEQELDCWPRTLMLEFDGNNEVTRTRMNWVRDRWGWNPGVFNLNVSLDDGALLIRGADERSLPGGAYWLLVQVDSLVIRGGTQTVTVDDDKETTLTLQVSEDPRRVRLDTPVPAWDGMIRDTLLRSGQTFDGGSFADWVASNNPRESRKACLMNLMAKLRTLPNPDEPFLAHVRRIFLTDVERIYVEVDDEILRDLRRLSAEDDRPFYDEGKPNSPTHLRLLTRAGATGYELQSFRQDGRNSMQVVVAYPPGAPAGARYYADVDIDLGNPLRDIEGFVIHMGELLSGQTTDHLELRDALASARQPTASFIYYGVTRERAAAPRGRGRSRARPRSRSRARPRRRSRSVTARRRR